MKFALLVFMLPFWMLAQRADTTSICSEIVDFPDKDAEFPGGMVQLKKFVIENFNFPEESRCPEPMGKLYLSFVVNCEGEVSNVEISRGINDEINASAIELIEIMPNWIPAEDGGKLVCSKVRLPMYIHCE